VAHACNPSYSGGRYQEDQVSKSAQANSLEDPISKKLFTKKKGWWSGSKYTLSSSPITIKMKTKMFYEERVTSAKKKF
jgi:hypothetical protein